MEFLSHMVVEFLIFWAIYVLFATVAAQICIFTNSVWGFPFFSHPPQHLLSVLFLMIAILTVMRWYLMDDFICIFLMTSDIEHLFMFLLGKCIFSSAFLFYFFLCWDVWAVYIWKKRPTLTKILCLYQQSPLYRKTDRQNAKWNIAYCS